MAFCGGCGAGLRDGARFCATCGQPTSAPSGKTVSGKVPVAVLPVAPAAPSPVAAPAPAKNRTPMIVAVLGVLAVVIGVTVGLVITSGGDEAESADASDSTNGGPSDTGDSTEDDSGSGSDSTDDETDSEPTFSEDVSFTVNSADNTFAPGDLIILSPSYGSGEGIDYVEFFVDGNYEGSFDPGEEISTSLPAGRHRLRLVVHPIDGPQLASSDRIVVERPVLGNPVPDNLRAIANRYSNALANDNWSLAGDINEGLGNTSIAEFEEGWGNVGEQFVVPLYADGNVLRLGLVVHQLYPQGNPNGAPLTKLFCNTWTINPATGTLRAESGYQPNFGTYGANADPYELQDELLTSC